MKFTLKHIRPGLITAALLLALTAIPAFRDESDTQRFCNMAVCAKRVKVKIKEPSPINKKITNNSEITRYPEVDSLKLEELREMITFSGFDKPASSRRETFLITNDSDVAISHITLDITYTDLEGRMLTRCLRPIDITIPAGETRMADIPTFDVQKSLYFKSSSPGKSSKHYTPIPFDVKIKLHSLSIPVAN